MKKKQLKIIRREQAQHINHLCNQVDIVEAHLSRSNALLNETRASFVKALRDMPTEVAVHILQNNRSLMLAVSQDKHFVEWVISPSVKEHLLSGAAAYYRVFQQMKREAVDLAKADPTIPYNPMGLKKAPMDWFKPNEMAIRGTPFVPNNPEAQAAYKETMAKAEAEWHARVNAYIVTHEEQTADPEVQKACAKLISGRKS